MISGGVIPGGEIHATKTELWPDEPRGLCAKIIAHETLKTFLLHLVVLVP